MKTLVYFSFVTLIAFGGACATSREIQTQKYAELSRESTFEYEFPKVWKAIEEVFRNHKIVERDPDEVDAVEMKTLRERSLETDWIYGKSKDKYAEFKVNDLPRRKYLQMRFKYMIEASRVIGGTKVKVDMVEEIENLDEQGMPDGYTRSDQPDSARMNGVLKSVESEILRSH